MKKKYNVEEMYVVNAHASGYEEGSCRSGRLFVEKVNEVHYVEVLSNLEVYQEEPNITKFNKKWYFTEIKPLKDYLYENMDLIKKEAIRQEWFMKDNKKLIKKLSKTYCSYA